MAKVFNFEDFPYESDIDFEEIVDKRSPRETIDNRPFDPPYGLNLDDLEIDKLYDIKDLAKSEVHLILYIDDNQVNSKSESEILLDIKDIFDEASVPFYTIDLYLQAIRTGNDDVDRDRNTFSIIEFFYSDIYEEKLPN